MTQAITGNSRYPKATRLPCSDACNRRRMVGILREPLSDRVVFIAPPGEAAVFSPDEARAVAQQLLAIAAGLDGEPHGIARLDSRRPG